MTRGSAALIQQAIEQMLAGEVAAGKSIVRNYVNATGGFVMLGRIVNKRRKA